MRYLSLFVFCNGMAIMALEMAAARFLAPYFGSSTIVWANIIGVIMAALALGYSLGGKFADKHPKFSYFYGIGILGGILLSVLPLFVQVLLNPITGAILTLPLWEILGSFIMSVLFFGIPVTFLAMLSPYAVRLASHEVSSVGSKAGNLYSWSTVGSILGVYISTFITIPFVGVKETMWIFALLILFLSICGLLILNKGKIGKLWMVLLVPIVFSILNAAVTIPISAKVLVQKESLYQHIKVLENENNDRYLVFNEGGGIQSVYNPNKLLSGFYYDSYPLFTLQEGWQNKKDLNVLIIGYAGGTIGKLFHAMNMPGQNLHIDGVEIDEEVTDISKKYMAVTDAERQIYTQDGRTYLKSTDKKYDIIIVDAYTREHYIPPHLITEEFFNDVSEHLTSDGRVLFNINAKNRDSVLLNTTINTLHQIFPEVELMPIKGSYNYILTAGSKKIVFQNEVPQYLSEDIGALFLNIKTALISAPKEQNAGIFTDNKNAIEHMTNNDIWDVFFVQK
ncbi:MAG: spermidine synthase [Candidatus Gracilibacteria bacterium]